IAERVSRRSLRKFRRLALEGGVLCEMPGLVEDKCLQLCRLRIAEMAHSEVAGYRVLILRDCWLPFAIEVQQSHIESQLRRAEASQFLDDTEWLLSGKAIEQSYERDLIGKAEWEPRRSNPPRRPDHESA